MPGAASQFVGGPRENAFNEARAASSARQRPDRRAGEGGRSHATSGEDSVLTTDYVPGVPSWVDIGTPDTGRAAAFYTGLFGWEAVSAGPEAGGYGFFKQDGKTVAGYGPLMAEGARTAWMIYFQTAEADVTAKSVQQAGGTVSSAPMDVMAAGRMAQFSDPAGAPFAVWQPGGTKGLDAVSDPGTFCWAELHTADPGAARSFYESVFGWHTEDMPMGDMTYTVISTSRPDSSFGGIVPLMGEPASHWQAYFEVPDCNATVAKAADLGGSVVSGPDDIPGVGRFAALTDPFGAAFSVITSAAPAS